MQTKSKNPNTPSEKPKPAFLKYLKQLMQEQGVAFRSLDKYHTGVSRELRGGRTFTVIGATALAKAIWNLHDDNDPEKTTKGSVHEFWVKLVKELNGGKPLPLESDFDKFKQLFNTRLGFGPMPISEHSYRYVKFYPKYRLVTGNLESALKSGADVLLLTYMSEHTRTRVEQIFDECKRMGTKLPKLRVLAWYPGESEAPIALNLDVVEAFRKTLGEKETHQEETYNQVRRALAGWRHLEKIWGKDVIEVRRYQSSPTMQGLIVKSSKEGESLAQIELLPYHTGPDERPALVLGLMDNPEIFKFFQDKWDLLWRDAEE